MFNFVLMGYVFYLGLKVTRVSLCVEGNTCFILC